MSKTHRKLVAGSQDRESLMADLSIHYEGRRYEYGGYHYDELADAVAYAELTAGRLHRPDCSSGAAFATIGEPNDADRRQMAALGIHFVEGVYRFQSYRYERLADAASYAKLEERRQAAEARAL